MVHRLIGYGSHPYGKGWIAHLYFEIVFTSKGGVEQRLAVPAVMQ